ncbi:hypothetical protein B0O99DRAFT_679961 [Bisporella sp. PMI_857]|nr:hypothetical protein B0O99DRAFT_679961 [Bisporella sp. PMI_857]
MRGIAESFQSMVDSSLCVFASAQLMIANDALNVPAIGSKRAVVIGQKQFLGRLARFGLRNIKSLVIGTPIGGNVVGSLALDAHWKRGTSWVGDVSDKVVGEIKVLMKTGGGLVLVADQRQDEL